MGMQVHDGEINPQNMTIERHNRRLFKRMCPYGSGFVPPLGHTPPSTHAAEDKTVNLHSAVSRPLILSAASLSPFLPHSSPSSRPNAAHNSRSQFSISADFSIRLRGAAIFEKRSTAPLRQVTIAPRPRYRDVAPS